MSTRGRESVARWSHRTARLPGAAASRDSRVRMPVHGTRCVVRGRLPAETACAARGRALSPLNAHAPRSLPPCCACVQPVTGAPGRQGGEPLLPAQQDPAGLQGGWCPATDRGGWAGALPAGVGAARPAHLLERLWRRQGSGRQRRGSHRCQVGRCIRVFCFWGGEHKFIMLLGKGGGSGGGSDSGSGSRLHVAACQPRRHLPCATEQHPRPNKAPGGSCQSSRHQARHVPAPLPGCREFAEETLGLFGGCGVDAAAVATSASAMAQQLRRADRCLLVVHPLRRGSYHMWVAAPGVSRTRAPGTPMPTTYQGAPAAKRGTHRADPPPPPPPRPRLAGTQQPPPSSTQCSSAWRPSSMQPGASSWRARARSRSLLGEGAVLPARARCCRGPAVLLAQVL